MHQFKYLILTSLLLSINILQAQVLTFDHGKVEFYTSSIMSDIEAISNEIEVKFDLESGAVEMQIPIESFEFEYELMQEHFNEEYMESDKFPNAIFVGKVVQSLSNLSENKEVDVVGKLTIHGITKDTQFKATISKNENFTIVKSKFSIAFKDFNVEEPAILSKSVAKDVEVKSTLYLK